MIVALAAATPLAVHAQGAAKAPKPAAAGPKPPLPKAAPPANAVESDARCLLSMALLSQDKTRQQAANIGVYYFTGRLQARGANVTDAVHAAEGKLAPAQIPAELQRCGPMVQGAMSALQATFSPPGGGAPPAGAPGAVAAPPAAALPAPAPSAAPPIIPTPK